jgi:hypothetical protein
LVLPVSRCSGIMDFVSVSMEKQGNKREWSRRIFGECETRSRRYTRGNPNRRQTCRAFGWTGMRWTCGKRRLAVGENGFISRNPLRSCGGLNCGTRERDATTPSSHKLFAPPRNLLRPCMVDSVCLSPSHAPPTPSIAPMSYPGSALLSRIFSFSDACMYWELELTIQPPYLR